MASDSHAAPAPSSGVSPDAIVRLGVVAVLVILAARVFAPFLPLLLWSLILAVALVPWQVKLAARLGGKQRTASGLLVSAGLVVLGVPLVLLAHSFAGHLHGVTAMFDGEGGLALDPPPASVAEWPVVGEALHGAWSQASTDLPAFLAEQGPHLRELSRPVLAAAVGALGSVALFLGALLVAGIMLAYHEPGSRALGRVISRLAGPERGPRMQSLCAATVRSVAGGVIGVAFVQALLLGVGFLLAGVPAAGVLALVVLLLGILQAPAVLVSLPVIAYLWMAGDGSTLANGLSSAYLLVAGMADNVLKPMLLGRGVDAPMPMILVGALGGMASGGVLGLFVGAVVMAVGYRLFMDWVDEEAGRPGEAAPSAEAG